MNTSQCAKIDKLLNYGLKSSEASPRAHLANVSYIDPTRVFMSRIYPVTTPDTVGVDIEKHQFTGKEETGFSEQCFTWAESNTESAYIDRRCLITLLNAMDSDIVWIRFREDSPFMVSGMMDRDLMVEGIIAPMIFETIDISKENVYYA